MTIVHSDTIRNSLANVVGDAIDAGANGLGTGAGLIEITTSSGLKTNTIAQNIAGGFHIANIVFSATAFDTAPATAVGRITAAAMTDDTNCTAGTAGLFTARDSDGTVVFDGDVSTSGADINLSSTAIGAGDTIRIESLTYEAAP
jgi:hypothetical protein